MTSETPTNTPRPSPTDSPDGADRSTPSAGAQQQDGDWDRLDGCPAKTYCVLGDGALVAAVTDRLRARGATVAVVDELPGVDASRGAPVDIATLDGAGLDAETTVIAATASDARNLLLAQIVRVRYSVERVLVLVHAPDRVEPFADAGHDPICATSTLSAAVVDAI